MESKTSLRRTAQHLRLDRSRPDLEGHLAAVLSSASRVASYVPLDGEPGVAPRAGWLLPVLLPDGDLDWGAYDGELVAGLRGTQQPREVLGVDAVTSCDVVLVPALLVDRHGVRLGKGGGSYDRALARCTGLTVALLDHDDELVEALPAEPHDVHVRAVVTPSRGLVRLPDKM